MQKLKEEATWSPAAHLGGIYDWFMIGIELQRSILQFGPILLPAALLADALIKDCKGQNCPIVCW